VVEACDSEITRTSYIYAAGDARNQPLETHHSSARPARSPTPISITERRGPHLPVHLVRRRRPRGGDRGLRHGDVSEDAFVATPPRPVLQVRTTSRVTALATHYEYDDAGRQSRVTHPDGTVTTYEYDDLGRLLLTIENETADADLRRITAYQYEAEDLEATTTAAW